MHVASTDELDFTTNVQAKGAIWLDASECARHISVAIQMDLEGCSEWVSSGEPGTGKCIGLR